MSAVRDETVPGPKWDFNEEVTLAFEDMLERSIPDYAGMRSAVFDVGSRFVKPGTSILDLGCSRGEAIAPFLDRFGAVCSYVLVERSAPMLDATRARFAGWISSGIVSLWDRDLRRDFPSRRASLILSVLTLQFTPLEHRQRIVRAAYETLDRGGALVVVEKVIGADAATDVTLTELYREHKRRNGYSDDAIDRKALALEGVLVPVTARWNEDLLHAAGFGSVECFWRRLSFAAWVAIK